MYATRPGHDDRRYPITVAKYDEVRDVAQLTVGVPSRVELEIRLSPLYDIVSTVYYPELSRDMAMKLGREYSAEKIMPPDFEQLAEEAGLGKAPGQTPRARACRDGHGRSRENRDAYKKDRKST